MTVLPPIGAFNAEAYSNAQAGGFLEQSMAFLRETVGGGSGQNVTISGGAITPDVSVVRVDTQDNASIDDLDRIDIAAFNDGAFCILFTNDASRRVRVRHGQGGNGQILLSLSVDETTLVRDSPSITLALQLVGNVWVERWRWYGSQIQSFRNYLGLESGAIMPVASEAEAFDESNNARIMTPMRVANAMSDGHLMIRARPAQGTLELTDWLLISRGDTLYAMQAQTLLDKSFVDYFETSDLPSVKGSFGSFTHNLARAPRLVQAVLICRTAEWGYGPGNQVLMDGNSANDNTRTLTVGFDATEVFYQLSQTHEQTVCQWSNGEPRAINTANWRVRLKCWS